MGWMSCATQIRAAAGKDLSDDDIEAIFDRILERKAAMQARAGGTLSDAEATAGAARDLGAEGVAQAAIARRNAALDLAARQSLRDRVSAAPSIAAGFRAEIRGINAPIEGARFSAEAEGKALSNRYTGGAVSELERAGLYGPARNGMVERDWVRELAELSKGPDGKPGITGSKEAQGIAGILRRYQNLAKENLNKVGGWIGDDAGYVAHQSHDVDKIRRAGFPAWYEAILPKLDERTFDGVGDRKAFLQRVYNALVSGVHLTETGRLGFKDPAFSGPGNLAKRLSQSRLLHFADADSWLDYQKRFGEPDALRGVLNGLNSAAKSTAIMRRFGTNPAAEFQNHIKYFQQLLLDRDPVAARKLGEAAHSLQVEFDTLDGTADRPVNRLGARVGSYTRLNESLAKLGGVVFTHLGAGFTKAAELRYQGIPLLESYRDFMQSFLRGRGAGETRQVMDLLGAGLEGMQRDILGRFQLDDGLPGWASKAGNLFFKLNGLSYVLNAQKAGAEFVLSRHLGSFLGRGFEALPAETQRALKLYGIDAGHWGALNSVTDHASIDGRSFLTPDAALRAGLDPDKAEDLAMRLHAYFHDSADRAIVTPGVADKALLLQGTRPGTVLGEALRFIAQFKQWPVAAIRTGLGRELYGGQSRPAAMAGILHMALGSVFFGYLRMVLSDLTKGKDPRDPTDPRTWAAAMMQGGGAGILGDYLFGEYNRFGQSPSEALLGPVLGQGTSTVIDLYNRMKANAIDEGQGHKDVTPEAFRLALDNTPFVNLFYVRTGLNAMWLWKAQEAMSPGYLERFERTTRRQTGQSFWLKPSAVVHGQAGAVRMPQIGGGP